MAGTHVGEGLSIDGEITCGEQLTVEGTVRGKLSCSDVLTVCPSGVVEADVTASSLSVEGQITGDVAAKDRVDLQSGGRLVGDVKTARLTIADGASFKGNVDMDV